MSQNKIFITPIGVIHCPFTRVDDVPIQPSAAQGVRGRLILNKETSAQLVDLDGFSHIYLIYFFIRLKGIS